MLHGQKESVVSSFFPSISNGEVFCHLINAGKQGEYPLEVGFNLQYPKGIMLLWACLSSSVACNLPARTAKF